MDTIQIKDKQFTVSIKEQDIDVYKRQHPDTVVRVIV